MQRRSVPKLALGVAILAGLTGFGEAHASTGQPRDRVLLATEPYDQSTETNGVFERGQILSAGMLSGSTVDGPPRSLVRGGAFPPIYRFAIAGGTQAYDGVQGQLEWQSGPDAVLLKFEFLD